MLFYVNVKKAEQTEMQTLLKIVLSVIIILTATGISRRLPSTAGLIGVMPLVGALVLVWVYIENRGDPKIMQEFTKGALWGILPSLLFYLVALFCFRRQFSLPIVLCLSFAVWFAAALIHQWIIK
jgi:uncharacterized membrane protein (GlpM family)